MHGPNTVSQARVDDARAQYLKGAELAQRQHYEEAVSTLRAALAADPTLHTARLQLGLLHLTMGKPAETLAVLQPLERCTAEPALMCFSQGLVALVHDDFPRCIASLEQGLVLNTANEPLNHDMRLILDQVRCVLITARARRDENPESKSVRTDFSLYEGARK